MSAKLVIQHIIDKKGINLNTLTDADFSKFSWLISTEPTYNIKGEKVSKMYYAYPHYSILEKIKYIISGNELSLGLKKAVEIKYHKLYQDLTTDTGIVNVLVGICRSFNWYDWTGNIKHTKTEKPYYFTLEPVYLGDGTGTLISYSSTKLRKHLKYERYNADDYLQSKSPTIYALLYTYYTSQYETYLRTGDKTSFVGAMNAETDPVALATLNHNVNGTTITIKDLIIMNLQ